MTIDLDLLGAMLKGFAIGGAIGIPIIILLALYS